LAENDLAEAGPRAGRADQAAPRLVALRQRPNLAAAAVAGQAAADLAELSAGYREVRVVLSPALATAWPEHPSDQVRVGPVDQPSTGIWWQLLDELNGPDRPDLLVAADYDPQLRYLCLAAIEPG
jgi:4-hydroxymandelate oxidase